MMQSLPVTSPIRCPGKELSMWCLRMTNASGTASSILRDNVSRKSTARCTADECGAITIGFVSCCISEKYTEPTGNAWRLSTWQQATTSVRWMEVLESSVAAASYRDLRLEEAFDLRAVEVNGHDVVHAHDFEHARDVLCSDHIPLSTTPTLLHHCTARRRHAPQQPLARAPCACGPGARSRRTGSRP